MSTLTNQIQISAEEAYVEGLKRRIKEAELQEHATFAAFIQARDDHIKATAERYTAHKEYQEYVTYGYPPRPAVHFFDSGRKESSYAHSNGNGKHNN